ncbi:MAG: exopolyphosphatase [Acidobacteriota bacterium]
MSGNGLRIVTRGDMDGLTSAVIISVNERVERVALIHPQDITSGKVEILPGDVLVNVPFHPNCSLWFDHHQHTATYRKPPDQFKGAYGIAPSAAHLVYEYYGGKQKMPQFEELVRETDRMDSADLTPEDVVAPKGYIELGFTIDSRTGIGAFEDYFLSLVELLAKAPPIAEVLANPAVKRRCQMMKENDAEYRKAVQENSRVEGNVVITDFRRLERNPIGNRFLVYALYPHVNVSLRLHWGPKKEFVVAAIGHSIFKRGCKSDVGEMAARHGGGGHFGAGSVPLPVATADEKISQIIEELTRTG